MKLFIIGNGFDIAHGMKTKFTDFREFLKKNNPSFLEKIERDHFCNYNDKYKNIFWNKFEERLTEMDGVKLFEDANIEFDLESGDIGIADTLYNHINDYDYINSLNKLVYKWIARVRKAKVRKFPYLYENSNDFFINFNYTGTLEQLYKINSKNVLHIHGAIDDIYTLPIMGHNDEKTIKLTKKELERSEREFNERMMVVYKILVNYYESTYKDIELLSEKLNAINYDYVDEILIFGHSVCGPDLKYFKKIDELTNKNKNWVVFSYSEDEYEIQKKNLISCGIDENRINILNSSKFVKFN